MLRRPGWRLAAFGAVVVTLFALAALSGPSPGRLRHSVESWGAMAPLAYCALGAALTLVFVPVAVVAGVAGLMFGTAVGFPVALAAATAGATIAFVIGRRLGGSALDDVQGIRIARVRVWIAERGVLAVIVARVTPLPSGLVNYAGGLTTLSLRTFLAGSVLGYVPRTFAYAAVGGSLDDPTSPTMLVAIALLAVVLVVGAAITGRDRRLRELVRDPSMRDD